MSAQAAQKSTDLALPEQKALTLHQRVVAAMGERDEAALQKLADGTKDITAITNPAGYQQVHAARMVLKNERIAIEKDCKKAREDAVAFGKAVIIEEKRLIGILAGEETRLETLQKDWDDARRREKEAKEAAERKRIEAIHQRIDEIRQYPLNIVGTSSANIEGILKTVVEFTVDDTFQELKQQAEGAKATTLIRLRAALANAQAMEVEQARLATERAENERIRLANEAAAEVERTRLAETVRLAKEELERERLRQEAAADIERGRLAEEERVAKVARDADAARQAAENERVRLENEKAAAAERQRIADENAALQAQREAQAAEAQRLIDEGAELQRQQEALRAEREKPAVIEQPTEDAPRLGGASSTGSTTEIAGAVDNPTPESASVAPVIEQPTDDPFLITLRLTEYLPMESVCKFAKEWAVFQTLDSKLDQKTDIKLAVRARQAEMNLLAVVEQLK